MELRDRAVALYGRFSAGLRDRLAREITRVGGAVARDLTRRSDVFVVGAFAVSLIESGALSARIAAARARNVPVFGEKRFAAALIDSVTEAAATYPLAAALSQSGLTRSDAELLSAFDIVNLNGDALRFGDVGTLKTAAELLRSGRSLADVVRVLARARDLAPLGRHKIVLGPSGEAALQWEDGLTSLEGQGYLPIEDDAGTVDDLFEAAVQAEAHGDLPGAARLYDMCARADRKDAIAPFNLANILLGQSQFADAALGYQRALARDQRFLEARYNLAQAFEALGRADAAAEELARVLTIDGRHADALFNLGQIEMQRGRLAAARALYTRYLACDPPVDWADKARKAVAYCTARLSA